MRSTDDRSTSARTLRQKLRAALPAEPGLRFP